MNRERRNKRHKQKRINAALRKRLFGHLVIAPCCYCRGVFLWEQLTIEHIIPLCLGGTNDDSNITLACVPCNKGRGKIAWRQKRHHEQYSPEHYQQNWEGALQNPQSPHLYYQGEGI
jgi:5-methylcytosine-specific restriction endonuclease McrA